MSWAVVMAKPNCEGIAVTNLERQGYECYFPRFLEARPGKVAMIKPLFPRYLFVLVKDVWHSIRGTRGVSYLLHGNDGISRIPDQVIASIKAKEGPNGLILLSENKTLERFTNGDKVKAIDGPFTGIELIYQGMAAKDRVRVLGDILGSRVPILIEERLLTTA